MKPRFTVSYRGESEYIFNGREYRVRYFADNDGHYTGNYYSTGIEPFVGCLSNRRDFHSFPDQEALDAFKAEYPGIVGARYADDAFTKVEYTEQPQTLTRKGIVFAKWFCDSFGY